MLQEPDKFIKSLLEYDKEAISEHMINQLKKYVTDPEFSPEKMMLKSKACTSLCQWIHAMYNFYHVNLVVKPKKIALAKANEELVQTEKLLAAAQASMQKVLDGIDTLNKQLEAKIAFKEEKEYGIRLCEERMNRAYRLGKKRYVKDFKTIKL